MQLFFDLAADVFDFMPVDSAAMGNLTRGQQVEFQLTRYINISV